MTSRHHPRPKPSERQVVVREVTRIAPEVTYLALDWAEPEPRFDFLAGQWVRVHFPIPGGEETRSLSIANPPSFEGGLELAALTRRGGRFARFVTADLRPGHSLRVKGPYGVFHLPQEIDHDPIFATESVGVTAIRSMVLDLFERGTSAQVDLLFGAAREEELLFRDEFEALAARHPNFRVTWVLTRPPEGWTGAAGDLSGALRALLAGGGNRKVWMSGFSFSLNPLADILAELRFPADRIEVERYD
ncbi:MAG: FAD-dependent oxidoreductase [Planctomycetes bacterium]|nr:FAD-dependent oxidoreductase [Planctomycetota bacterium]